MCGTVDDGTAYLLYASDNNVDFKVGLLDDDYYNITSVASEIAGSLLCIMSDSPM